MITSGEKIQTTPIHETQTEQAEPKIAGVLREPIVQSIGPDQLSVNYHWETPDDKHTYLHLLLRKSPDDPFGVAHANIDSSDVKGQGDALWDFLGDQLQDVSDRGHFPVYHDVNANDYSRRLPEADPRYVRIDENRYRGVFTPTPREPILKTYHSDRL
jgi:hypothetical protein